MNTSYLLILSIGAVICAFLFAWRLKRQAMNACCALIALPLGVLFGAVLSKGLYCLLLYSKQFGRYGFQALLRDKPAEFSFVGGCLGAVLGVCLAARLVRQPLLKTLDVFAPLGSLLAAVARAGEYHLGLVGAGSVVGSESLQFFPIAYWNESAYGWFYAIFMLETLAALACAAFSLGCFKKKGSVPGYTFLATLFLILIAQVFCESLRSKSMKWGFVRIEQLICGLSAFALVLYTCIKYKGPKRFLPALCTLPCLLMLIAVEFFLDKPLFGTYLPKWLCYLVMLSVLAVMTGLFFRSLKKAKEQ